MNENWRCGEFSKLFNWKTTSPAWFKRILCFWPKHGAFGWKAAVFSPFGVQVSKLLQHKNGMLRFVKVCFKSSYNKVKPWWRGKKVGVLGLFWRYDVLWSGHFHEKLSLREKRFVVSLLHAWVPCARRQWYHDLLHCWSILCEYTLALFLFDCQKIAIWVCKRDK